MRLMVLFVTLAASSAFMVGDLTRLSPLRSPVGSRVAAVTARAPVLPPPPNAIAGGASAVATFCLTRGGAVIIGAVAIVGSRMWYTYRYGDGARFIASDEFTGKKEGYTYRKGLRGSGFYKVKVSASKTAPATKNVASQKEPDVQDLVDFGGSIFSAALDLGGQAISAAADAVTKDDAAPARASIYNVESEERESGAEGASATEQVEMNLVQAEDEEVPFIAATNFVGKKPGYVFKSGPVGIGYYNRDYEWV